MDNGGYEFFTYREDKKCGNSGIPDGAKCTKGGGGTATATSTGKKRGPRSNRKKAATAIAAGVAAAGLGTLAANRLRLRDKSKELPPAQKKLKGGKEEKEEPTKNARDVVGEARDEVEKNVRKAQAGAKRTVRKVTKAVEKATQGSKPKKKKDDRMDSYNFYLYREDAAREDKKCGNSGIPDGAKCTKGGGSGGGKGPQRGKITKQGVNTAARLTAAGLAGAGLAAGLKSALEGSKASLKGQNKLSGSDRKKLAPAKKRLKAAKEEDNDKKKDARKDSGVYQFFTYSGR